MFSLSITDHRQRPTRLYGPGGDVPRATTDDRLSSDVRRRIHERIGEPLKRAEDRQAWAITVVCVTLSLWLVPVLMKSGLSWYAWTPLVVLANLGSWLGVALVYRWLVHRIYSPQIVAAFLAERLCPTCAYDLSNAPTAGDGCCVCPECGAAWRVPVNPSSPG